MATLIAALRDPASVAALDGVGWSALISVARCEALLGTLAVRLDGQAMPDHVNALLAATRAAGHVHQLQALWEADRARAALAPLGIVPVLLKGTAYVAAGLTAAQGRQVGDLDILVPRDRLGEVEAALLAAGWQWLKPDPYDDAYYRRWMHELPPLIHGEREKMIDVHHTILPLTHRAKPNAAAMLADALTTPDGWRVLSPDDMIIHCAAHCMADGELDGGLRNLWDFHCLMHSVGPFSQPHLHAYDSAMLRLDERARQHGLTTAFARAEGLSRHLFAPSGMDRALPLAFSDRLILRRLGARDDWGRQTRPLTRFAFYLRSHWLRMPPLMLARHLWAKWRRR